jgi:hypothetical protein
MSIVVVFAAEVLVHCMSDDLRLTLDRPVVEFHDCYRTLLETIAALGVRDGTATLFPDSLGNTNITWFVEGSEWLGYSADRVVATLERIVMARSNDEVE